MQKFVRHIVVNHEFIFCSSVISELNRVIHVLVANWCRIVLSLVLFVKLYTKPSCANAWTYCT